MTSQPQQAVYRVILGVDMQAKDHAQAAQFFYELLSSGALHKFGHLTVIYDHPILPQDEVPS